MVGEDECTPVYRHSKGSAHAPGGLHRFLGVEMAVMPVVVVLAALHKRKIEAAEAFADGGKMRAVTAVAAEKHLSLRRRESEAAPLGRVLRQEPPGEMLGGQDMHREIL